MVATRVPGAGPEVADRGVECGLRTDASDGSSIRVYTARNWYRVNQVVWSDRTRGKRRFPIADAKARTCLIPYLAHYRARVTNKGRVKCWSSLKTFRSKSWGAGHHHYSRYAVYTHVLFPNDRQHQKSAERTCAHQYHPSTPTRSFYGRGRM